MQAKQQKLRDLILAQIRHDGWTAEAFAQGVKKSGMTVAQAKKYFPRGIADIVDAFHGYIDDAMQRRIAAKRNFPTQRVRDKITFAVRARLEAVEPHRNAIRRLMFWSLRPQHVRDATRRLWQAADRIWVAAGDASTDYNYYTKRLLLIAVMKTTLAFWLQDESAGRQETWDFLDRRIEDIMKLGKGLSVLKAVGIEDILSYAKNFAAKRSRAP